MDLKLCVRLWSKTDWFTIGSNGELVPVGTEVSGSIKRILNSKVTVKFSENSFQNYVAFPKK